MGGGPSQLVCLDRQAEPHARPPLTAIHRHRIGQRCRAISNQRRALLWLPPNGRAPWSALRELPRAAGEPSGKNGHSQRHFRCRLRHLPSFSLPRLRLNHAGARRSHERPLCSRWVSCEQVLPTEQWKVHLCFLPRPSRQARLKRCLRQDLLWLPCRCTKRQLPAHPGLRLLPHAQGDASTLPDLYRPPHPEKVKGPTRRLAPFP